MGAGTLIRTKVRQYSPILNRISKWPYFKQQQLDSSAIRVLEVLKLCVMFGASEICSAGVTEWENVDLSFIVKIPEDEKTQTVCVLCVYMVVQLPLKAKCISKYQNQYHSRRNIIIFGIKSVRIEILNANKYKYYIQNSV